MYIVAWQLADPLDTVELLWERTGTSDNTLEDKVLIVYTSSVCEHR